MEGKVGCQDVNTLWWRGGIFPPSAGDRDGWEDDGVAHSALDSCSSPDCLKSIKIEKKSRKNAKDGCFPSGRNLESTVLPALCLTSLTCPSPGPELEALTDKIPQQTLLSNKPAADIPCNLPPANWQNLQTAETLMHSEHTDGSRRNLNPAATGPLASTTPPTTTTNPTSSQDNRWHLSGL